MRKIIGCSAMMLLTVGFVYAGGETVELGSLKSTTPANWKRQPPSNKLRMAQFAIPKADGDKDDGELAISHFGKGGGGSNDDNIKRWKDQFFPPEGKTIDEVTKINMFKLGKAADIVYVDIPGTYKHRFPPFDPNAKVTRKENYRSLNVILDSDDGLFFIRLIGPAKTMEKAKAGFDGWIKGYK